MLINIRNVKIKIIAYLALAACVMSSVSCKKEETTKLYLDGSLSLGDIPTSVLRGESITITPTGVSHPEDHALGLYFSVSGLFSLDTLRYADGSITSRPPLSNSILEQKAYSFKIPFETDSLATYTVTVGIYPVDNKAYYSTSKTLNIVVLDNDKSIPQIEAARHDVTDARDGFYYDVANIGANEWLTRNVAYSGTEKEPLGIAYVNQKRMSYIFGRYYTWDEAKEACPEGWRLPTNAEFDALGANESKVGSLMVNAYFNRNRMWEYWPAIDITATTGFNAIPAGYCNAASGKFTGAYSFAAFWTADEAGADTAYYRYINEQVDMLQLASADKSSMAMSVRCVRK